MSTTSPFIKMTLQALDENENTWGSVLNSSALELLEDAIAGAATVSVTSGNIALNEDAGSDNNPHYRMMIIRVSGSAGTSRNVTCPATSQVYVVENGSDDDVVFKTTSGTGVTIPSGATYFVYCDGTNVEPIGSASSASATTATTATNSTQLGGVAAANYARLGVQQTFTAGQTVQRAALTAASSVITPNIATSTAFYYLTNSTDGNFQLAAPTNPVNGSMFSLIIEQGSGAPHTISFASSTFIWEGGSAPVLSTSSGNIDYLAFEYVTNLSGGARWIGSIIKGLS